MNLKSEFNKNLNVPNVLSVIRLLLVPAYLIYFSNGHKYTALMIFVIASITDFIDGYIARKYKLITNFGKLMDPLADKIMVLSAMFSMAIGNSLITPVIPWTVVIILLIKELVLVVGGGYLLKKGYVAYSFFIGKIAHCFFIAGLILSYFHDYFQESFANWFLTPDLIILWIAVILTLCALACYVRNAINELHRIKKESAK